MTYKPYLLLCFICLSDLIYLLSHFIKNFIKNYLKITFKRKSRVKLLHNFSEKIVYGKNANYLITLDLNSQKAGYTNVCWSQNFFCLCHK